MANEPQSSEAQMALYVGSAIGSSLIGGAATELITNPIFSLVGIKKSDDTLKRYLDQISEKHDADLGSQID